MTDSVRDHYQAGIKDETTLLATVTRLLEAIEPPLTAAKLASFDQFHTGGLAATVDMAKRAALTRDLHVLDAGSGLGGPSRFLAETIGCPITGVDLAPSYVAIARLLAERAGLADAVTYRVGSILELPFADGGFDVVWSQHVAMNIRDRVGLYRELRRVVKVGGRFVFYDAYVTDGAEAPPYPLPWAETPATSTLLTKEATIAALEATGWRVVAFDDVTNIGLDWLGQQQQQMGQALTLGTVLGERGRDMVANLGRGLREGRLRLVMGASQAA